MEGGGGRDGVREREVERWREGRGREVEGERWREGEIEGWREGDVERWRERGREMEGGEK